MNVFLPILLSSIAGFSTLIGFCFIIIPISQIKKDKFLTFCLSFSCSIMIGISVFDLLPEAYNNLFYLNNNAPLIILILLLISFIVITIFNLLFNNMHNRLYKLGILSSITLILHNFPEGIITFLSSYYDIDLGIKLVIAIILHNIPEGITIALPIYYGTNSKIKALKYTLISSLAEPLGAIITYLFVGNNINIKILNSSLVIVSGLMITLAINNMLPEALKYKQNKYILLGLFIGIFIVFLNMIL